MTIEEFIETTKQIENYYGKEYTEEQKKIIFDNLKILPIARYRMIVAQIFRICQYMPNLAKIIEINNLTKYEPKKEERTDCKKCNGNGYIVYKKEIEDGEKKWLCDYVARCNCAKGNVYKAFPIINGIS